MEDHGKELKRLDERVSVVEKKEGGSDGSSAIKVDIDWLKKEVTSLKSMDISSLWDMLDVPPRVEINLVPKGVPGVNVSSEGNEEVNVPYSLETDEEALGVESCLLELEELRMIQEDIIATVTKDSL